MNAHDTAESRLKDTLFVVEATSFEQHVLWQRHAVQAEKFCPGNRPRLDWQKKFCPDGWLVTVGELDAMPCCICICWVTIDGHPIAFYYDCSVVMDTRQTGKWLKENFTGRWDHGTRWAVTDAPNFHHCIAAIREKHATKE